MRSTPERDAWLKDRLQAAVDKKAGGSVDKLGRMLGYTNGGYLREILLGKKPLRAAIIERAEGVDELRGWFGAPGASSAAKEGEPRKFTDLEGPEAQLVMHLRWLHRRAAEAGADWANGVLQLVSELVEMPDAKRDQAIGAALQQMNDVRYGTPAKAKEVETSVGAALPPSPTHHPSPRAQSSGSRATTLKRTAK
jgi:hypothetical protein